MVSATGQPDPPPGVHRPKSAGHLSNELTPELPGREGKRLSQAAAERLGTRIDRTATSWEPKYTTGAIAVFQEEQRAILATLEESKRLAWSQKASIEWSRVVKDVQAYYDSGEAGEEWRKVFTPILRGSITDHVEALNAEFGMTFAVRDLLAEEWFEKYVLQFAQPLVQTSSDELSTLLQQGQREGWSIPEAQKHIETLFRQWQRGDVTPEQWDWAEQRMPPYRTELIARTSAIQASNQSSNQLFKAWGAPKKEWLTRIDGREREAHHKANRQVVGIDEMFTVGGYKMNAPHDPSAPADLVIQCRCTLLPVL